MISPSTLKFQVKERPFELELIGYLVLKSWECKENYFWHDVLYRGISS